MAILRFTGPLAFPGPRGRVCPVLLAALFLLPAGAGPAGAQVQPTVPAAPGTPPAPPALGNVSGAAAADPTVTGVGLTTHLERIDRQEQLAELALPLDEALYVKFVLDRRTDRLYYVNTPLFPFHYHFVLEVLQGGRPGAFPDIHAFGDACYRGEQRPYLLGTLVVPPRGAPHFQLLEQDVPSAALIRQGWLKLRSTFGLAGGRLSYRPLSQAQSELLPQLGDLPVIAALTTADAGATQLLNPGKAVGQLTVIPAGADLRQQPPGPEQIVVLQDLPMDITPVAGILCATFSTPLSHVNLRARSWGIPHMAFRQLPPEAAALDGRWVLYEVTASGATLRQASPAEVEAARQRRRAGEGKVRIPRADLARRDLPALAELGAADAISAGAKAANLGVLFGARGETFDVPPGLAIPFGHYLDFLAHNQLAEAARRMAEDASLADDPRRCLRLENLQHQIRQGRHTEAFRQALLARVQRLGLQGGLFVRSSTNAEDLEGFSGAGLYDTIPNV
ncbi:MAG: hypothetical protein FJ125_18425, partial [Deltaproteobacteria bacterium]|nr:hypothetical protein [Deltaproteobacteria bacterium]